MILSKKIRIIPSVEQEQKLWQSVGTARFIYNWTLARQEENYKNGGKFISNNDLRKEITILKKSELQWMGRNSQNTVVVFPKENYSIGEFVMVRVENCTSATLLGKAVGYSENN